MASFLSWSLDRWLFRKKKKLLTCTVTGFFKMYYLPKYLCDPPSLSSWVPYTRDSMAEMELNWDRGNISAFMLTGGSTKKIKNPFDTAGVPRVQAQQKFLLPILWPCSWFVCKTHSNTCLSESLKVKGGATDTHFWAFSFTAGRKW